MRKEVLEGSHYLAYRSKKARGSWDCRMMDINVPIFSSAWFGTGTVIVDSSVRFCITT